MAATEQSLHIACCFINQACAPFRNVVHAALSAFNFCFLGVIPKPFPKEQSPKSNSACLTPDLVVNYVLSSRQLHLVH